MKTARPLSRAKPGASTGGADRVVDSTTRCESVVALSASLTTASKSSTASGRGPTQTDDVASSAMDSVRGLAAGAFAGALGPPFLDAFFEGLGLATDGGRLHFSTRLSSLPSPCHASPRVHFSSVLSMTPSKPSRPSQR